MFYPPAIITAAIACVLGTWGATLLWRVWHVRSLERRARRGGTSNTIVPTLSLHQRRAGVVLGGAVLLLATGVVGAAVRMQAADEPMSLVVSASLTAAALLTMLGCGAVCVGLWFDLSHGRRRCPGCWYDMTATEGGKCPECGRVTTRERSFRKTRRAPRLLMAAPVLLIGAYLAYFTPVMREQGWGAAVPTTVMIVGMPWLNDLVVPTTQQRLSFNSMTEWQKDMLTWRCQRTIRLTQNWKDFADAVDVLHMLHAVPQIPKVSPPLQVAIGKQLCEGKIAVGTKLWSEWQVMPEKFDPVAAAELVPVIRAALMSGDEGRELSALACIATMGDGVEQFVPDLISRAVDPARSDRIAINAQWGLKQATPYSAEAKAARLEFFDHSDARVRQSVCRMVDSSFLEARPHVVKLMNDPLDQIAGDAAVALVILDGCDAVPQVMALATSRPATTKHFIERLAMTCQDPSVAAFVKQMLESSDSTVWGPAAWGAGRLGEAGLPLLDMLHAIVADEAKPTNVRQLARESIRQIEAASCIEGPE